MEANGAICSGLIGNSLSTANKSILMNYGATFHDEASASGTNDQDNTNQG
jgi:hypothetical protein